MNPYYIATLDSFIAIKAYVPDKNNFDIAFSNLDITSIKMIGNLILRSEEVHTVYFRRYNEMLDFLDGNGFKVEGNDTDGYIISLLNN